MKNVSACCRRRHSNISSDGLSVSRDWWRWRMETCDSTGLILLYSSASSDHFHRVCSPLHCFYTELITLALFFLAGSCAGWSYDSAVIISVCARDRSALRISCNDHLLIPSVSAFHFAMSGFHTNPCSLSYLM